MRLAFRSVKLSAMGAVLAGLAACAGQQPSPALDQARGRVSAVSQDPTVAQQAPLELQRARQSLQAAEAAYERDDDSEIVNHRAYIAAQQAAIAREVAQARAAREQIKGAEAERTRVLLEARERQTQGLQRELADLQARQTPRGTVVTLGNVLFRVDSAELVPGATAQLDRLAEFLRNHPEARAEIEGYTDSSGSDTYNLGLSQRRADTVRQALVRSGVDPSRITARGFGEAAPVASNDTTTGRQMNRRVEVVVSGPGLSPQASGTVGSGTAR